MEAPDIFNFIIYKLLEVERNAQKDFQTVPNSIGCDSIMLFAHVEAIPQTFYS